MTTRVERSDFRDAGLRADCGYLRVWDRGPTKPPRLISYTQAEIDRRLTDGQPR